MKNAMITVDFWSDAWVVEQLDPSERLVYLYLLTHPKRNWAGLFEFSLREASFHIGFEKDVIDKILNRFEKAKKIARSGHYVLLLNFIKHQKINPNIEVHIQKILGEVPESVMADFGVKVLRKAYSTINVKFGNNDLFDNADNSNNGGANGLVRNWRNDKQAQEEPHPLRFYIAENYPNVSRLRQQMTNSECESLLARYPKQIVVETLDAMENHKALNKKYISVFRTLNNWIKKREENGTSNKGDNYAGNRRNDAGLPEVI